MGASKKPSMTGSVSSRKACKGGEESAGPDGAPFILKLFKYLIYQTFLIVFYLF